MKSMLGNPMDDEGIHGNIYYTGESTSIGIVLGTGILGNRYGLEDCALALAQTPAYVVTLDPPDHHKNIYDGFSFGRYSENEYSAASYLRQRYNLETIIGGGHSSGSMAGIFAVCGYSSEIERRVIANEDFSDALQPYEKVFDGLILAGMPLDARKTIPWFMFNRFALQVAHSSFHKDNRTSSENFTHYEPKSTAGVEWKHFIIKDFEKTKNYVKSFKNPHEYVHELEKLNNEDSRKYLARLRNMPKIVFIGDRDALNFGLKTMFLTASRKNLNKYREQIDVFGINDDNFHILPASHFMNKENSYEIDSLWGLKSRLVQYKIREFIHNHFLNN